MSEIYVPHSEFSFEFIRLMKNRMDFSYYKYGMIKDAYPHKVNALESMEKRLEKYRQTGNTEWLVDAANFLMIEFMLPAHPKAHFKATESHESPGRFSLEDGMTNKDNSQLTNPME